MKNDQKKFNLSICTIFMHVRTTYHYCLGQMKWMALNNHIWSLNLNFIFKPTSFNLFLVALAQNTFILPCHDHASYCALHWLCSLLCCRYLSPLDGRDTDDVIVDTDEELYYLQKCQASKTPLFIPIKSHCRCQNRRISCRGSRTVRLGGW